MLKKLAYNTSMRVLNAWKHYLHELKRHEHLMKQSLARIKEREKLAAFSAWFQMWSRNKHNKAVLKRSAAKMKRKTLAAAFEG